MTTTAKTCTVAEYLAVRLEQLGITHLFGVPGNHLGPFLSTLHEKTGVRWVGTPTEGGAGQAADGYTRVKVADAEIALGEQGIGAAAVTYGVGAFNLLNAVGGAFTEYVPLIAINAAPTYEQWLNQQAIGLLTSHMSQRPESNLDIYRQVTVDAQAISNPGLAPTQIDGALTACLSHRRPVYLEVMEDVWEARCPAPRGRLTRRERPPTAQNRRMLDTAVTACVDLVRRYRNPVLWAGEEIDRFNLSEEFEKLVRETRIPFCTTVGAKSVVSEYTPGFSGVYNGKASHPDVAKVFQNAGCRIGLGSWATSKNLGGKRSIGEDWAVAAHEGVHVGASYFPDVQLAQFIPALRERLVVEFGAGAFAADYFARAYEDGLDVPESTAAHLSSLTGGRYPENVTYDSFFRHINAFLESQTEEEQSGALSHPFTVVSDAAFALIGSMNLRMAERASYVAQNSWLSIGYSVGAATGVALGRRSTGKRPMVFVGDGSFQETCQELSTHVRHGLRPIVFVLDNEGFYGIEQMLVHPCYYKGAVPASDGADFYNNLHPWRYEELAKVFGSEKQPMHGVAVRKHDDLEKLLKQIAEPHDPINRGPIVVRVKLARHDYPRALQYKIDENCPPPVGEPLEGRVG
ncbi:alpha-keto acid decarboxylase family protein [Streptomyces piniterrae]|uniref:Alpha-keto-acid decarboxylase n=1 Tax=Streptomyces piniterrae TaxID=2571125 RepID=A0A4U0N7A0_9ACTN|nr:thiamine pyrophosphate-binding protein [Streptomyces piniterrae]TJZ49681.1 alpha-keto acid decarboxylase family protein [Streptomyces piniterrae]